MTPFTTAEMVLDGTNGTIGTPVLNAALHHPTLVGAGGVEALPAPTAQAPPVPPTAQILADRKKIIEEMREHVAKQLARYILGLRVQSAVSFKSTTLSAYYSKSVVRVYEQYRIRVDDCYEVGIALHVDGEFVSSDTPDLSKATLYLNNKFNKYRPTLKIGTGRKAYKVFDYPLIASKAIEGLEQAKQLVERQKQDQERRDRQCRPLRDLEGLFSVKRDVSPITLIQTDPPLFELSRYNGYQLGRLSSGEAIKLMAMWAEIMKERGRNDVFEEPVAAVALEVQGDA